MKSFKRIISFMLALLMVLGMISVEGTAFAVPLNGEGAALIDSSDSQDVVGMTVSAGSSLITIKVNRVGVNGTATLYRMAANEYAAGDEMTGKSQFVSETGTVVGEYSCGSTQEFQINRYLSDGSDNLFDKYYLIQKGTILCGPVYASEITSVRSKPAFETINKKGLTLEDGSTIDMAKEIGANNTVINMDLSTLIVATEDANGNPRDLSKRTDLIEFESNGKTYYFKSDYIRAQDGLISAYSKAGMNVTLVLITWAKTLNADYPAALKYWNQTNRQTLAYNTANERGMEYWVAAMEFLADRYSQSANLGLVDKFIIGNEIDLTYDWYLIEPLQKNANGHYYAIDFDIFMEEFARTFRLANLAVKKYNSEAKVCVSFSHNWAMNSAEGYRNGGTSVRQNSYRPKEIVDWLVKYEGARGNYDWGLAVHPYPIGTYTTNPLITDANGYNGQYHAATGDPDTTPWITVANLEVYQLYLQRPENTYKGEVRTVSLTEASVLSVNSAEATYATSVKEQAAAIAMMYYRAANVPCIDQIAYFQPHDQTETSYMVGLITSDGVEKPAYNVWKYIDTDKSFVYANKYLPYITAGLYFDATSYRDLMGTIPSAFNWDTMWDEDNIMTRTVETGDADRTFTLNSESFDADDPILVTATGDVGDTIELFLKTDNIDTAEPLYSYPVVGTQNGVKFRSGGTYDLLAYGEMNVSRAEDAKMKAGTYTVVLRRGDIGMTIADEITITSNYSMGGTALSLKTDKETYAAGENIIVTATGNTDCWVGLYKAGDVYGTGNTTSIFWYYNNDPAGGHISGKPTILQSGYHNTDSSNPGMTLAPGSYRLYLFDGSVSTYHVALTIDLTVTEASLEPLTGITYKLERDTDGFANGVVTITKDSGNDSATDCIMYWADENGVPLSGYTSLGKFKLTGARTVYQMPTHTVIPAGAETLIAFASNGVSKSSNSVSVALPDNCGYDLSEDPIVEFQIVSDTHVTTDAGATGDVSYANQHFTMMLEDVQKNSPDSIGIFINGDVVNTGSAAEFDKVRTLWRGAKGTGTLPDLHISIGNHDWIQGNPGDQFQYYAWRFNTNLEEQPEKVYYDEVVGGYHFIYLGGEQSGLRAFLSEEQLNWFDNRMAAITAEDPDKPVFVFLHQSFYNTVAGSLPGQGWDGIGNEKGLKAVMEKYGQIIFFNGHSHWELNSESNMYPGDKQIPTALNTASVGYLWTSYNVMGGEFMDGTHGYFVRVYDDKVVFMGRDFENELFIPSATYVIQRGDISNLQNEYNVVMNKTPLDLGATAGNSIVRYASSDTSVVSVTDDGIVIPKKAGTAQIAVMAEPTNTHVVTKKFITINVSKDSDEYRVVFKNWDGSVLSTNTYHFGDAVTLPQNPTRPADDDFTYVFAGWDKPVVACNGDAVYTAVYNKIAEGTIVGAIRVYGSTRYETAFKAADALKESMGVDKFDAVVVACGTDFADALSGSYLSCQKNAPILLVRNNGTDMKAVKDYIKENVKVGGTVYLLGGTAVVPAAMERGLSWFTVKRLAGSTRYMTNLEILNEAGMEGKDLLVCSGKSFPDGLSASATNLPVLLVKDSLSTEQRALLSNHIGKIYIIGGTGAVSTGVENALKAYGTTERIGGATRYETSVNIAKKFFPNTQSAVLAYGVNFPDGLSGGPLAANMNAPLIMTAPGKQGVAVEYARQQGIIGGYVLGGSTLITDYVTRSIFGLATDAEINVSQ